MFQRKAKAIATVKPMKFVVLATLLAVGSAVALSGWAQPAGLPDGGGQHRMHHAGPQGGDFGFGGRGLFMGSPERLDRGVDRVLRGLDATEAQRAQVKQIVRSAAVDLKPIHETVRRLRHDGAQLFAAPVVDARAVEANRAELVSLHDQASRRISQAMLDISTVLTPEQRARLAEKIRQRQERMKERMHDRMTSQPGAASATVR